MEVRAGVQLLTMIDILCRLGWRWGSTSVIDTSVLDGVYWLVAPGMCRVRLYLPGLGLTRCQGAGR